MINKQNEAISYIGNNIIQYNFMTLINLKYINIYKFILTYLFSLDEKNRMCVVEELSLTSLYM